MPVEQFIILLLLLVVVLLTLAIVLPIIALVRANRIGQLTVRLDRMERELSRIRGTEAREALVAEAPDAGDEVTAIPEVPDTLPVGPAMPIRGPTPRHETAPPAPETEEIESWIGRRALGWVAVVLLLLATAFFIKHAFENRWVGEVGRVAIGILAGAAFCLVGLRYHKHGWRRFSQMLTAAGVVLLFLATYGAFGYYHLIPREWAGIFLVIIVIETVGLAILYESPAIAIMAVIGGLLNPVLLHSERDQYQALFTYLAVLNAGVVGLALFRRWFGVTLVAILGTHSIFWSWYAARYHPEKLWAAVAFQSAIFLLYLVYSVLARGYRPAASRMGAAAPLDSSASLAVSIEDHVRLVLNAFFFALAGYTLLDDDYHVWMGTAAIGMAIIHASLGWLLLRWRPQDQIHVLVATATGLAFLAMAFPLQSEAAWIGLGWAVQALALWWFGLRLGSGGMPMPRLLRIMAVVLFVLAGGRLVLVDTPAPWKDRPLFMPIFNTYALPALGIAACLLGAALAAQRLRRYASDIDRVDGLMAGLAGVLLLWFVLSIETFEYARAWAEYRRYDALDVRLISQTSLSILWAVYAMILMAVGFWLRSRPLRWVALGLFGLTLCKILLIDMGGLSGFYRVLAFFILAVTMGLAAWGYQKLERAGARGT